MKVLKFTPENLDRHIHAFPYSEYDTGNGRKFIFTARDEIKGKIGEVFLIEGLGKFCLTSVETYKRMDTEGAHAPFLNWESVGFSSEEVFWNEMYRIYGKDLKRIYLHKLLKLYGDD